MSVCWVLMILAAHFTERLGDQIWVLHDARRSLAALYNGASWWISEVPLPGNLVLHADEEQMQGYWQEYFRRIAIVERHNPNLQRQLMPKKYWKYLTEKQGKSQGVTT